ncbi:PaaX family transcriptional regulator [Lampropedia aestuarii]|uniref:PaaX family transcriptional regulator n=1 Tax=Lampropedia aestuarii TaxID=2562762 RepID=A0A4S5BLP9_9BURK|nr:PaaX family transcriptional regulator [Lampropedia aestuarii]THJ33484.1 PaaX family transcriptional regulator [Lampropedia aestuarii]
MHSLRNIELRVPRTPVLILDLLMARDAPLSANAICRVGELMGISQATMRVGLTRLVTDGKIQRSQRGLYSLARDVRALHRTVDQWQNKHALAVAWRERDWIAVYDGNLSKSDRAVRRRHALSLALFGIKELRPGLHVRPNNLKGGIAVQSRRLRELGMARSAIVFKASAFEQQDQSQAMHLWDIEQLIRTDDAFIAALEQSTAALPHLPLGAAAKESLLLGRAVIAHLVRDPVLPIEMMPRTSRDKLLLLATQYQREARNLWSQWFEEAR